MAILNLDYDSTTEMSIPVVKRTQDRLDWMKLHSKPLKTLSTNFTDYYEDSNFMALHNSQIMVHEHFLNTILSPIMPIYITDEAVLTVDYIYLREEYLYRDYILFNRSEGKDPMDLYTRVESLTDELDYTIHLSIFDAALEAQLDSYALLFKPAGKTYEIEIYY